jgi:uncharacterized alpha-E superfamily protein
MLLSRLAETAFWLGRYLERAGSLSRAMFAYEQIRLDIPGQDAPGWQRLASLAGVEPDTASRLEPSAFVARVLLDRSNPSALLGAIQLARENLRRARFLLPAECWHTLNSVYLRLDALSADAPPADVNAMLDDVVAASGQLAGQIAAGMLRDEGYAFLRMGAHLERADMTLRVLTLVAETLMPVDRQFRFEDVRMMGLLKSVGAYQPYRRRFHARTGVDNALELLLFEPSFPRSLAYDLLQIGRDLATLPRHEVPQTALGACWPAHGVSTREALDRFAADALERLARLGSALEATYFSPPVGAPQQAPARRARAARARRATTTHHPVQQPTTAPV